MIAARARFLAAGHYAPLAGAVAGAVRSRVLPCNLVVEAGAGTGYYLSKVLDARPECFGLAIDVSKHAARRAAKAHPRVDAIVGDVWDRLPLDAGASALTLVIFAPRQPAELARTLHPQGLLVVVTPQPEHLSELRGKLDLLAIDPLKESRIASAFAPYFQPAGAASLEWRMNLTRQDVEALVGMGPSARHTGGEALARGLSALDDPVSVTAAVTIRTYRRA